MRASLLQSGFLLEDPHELAAPMEQLVKIGMGIDKDEPVEKIDFSMSEDDPDTESEDDKKEEVNEEEVEDLEEGGEEVEGEPEEEDNNNEEEAEEEPE